MGRRGTAISAVELATPPLVVREHGSGTRDALDAALRASLGPSVGRQPPAGAARDLIGHIGARRAADGPRRRADGPVPADARAPREGGPELTTEQ